MDIKSGVIGVLVLIVILTVFVPVITDMVSTADNQYECTSPYSIQCTDIKFCTNETAVCGNATAPIHNVTVGLCTNASGVGIWNLSTTAGCDTTGWYISATDVGLSVVEVALFGVLILILVISIVYGVVMAVKNQK